MIISSRAICEGGRPTGWYDKIRLRDVTDGASNTFLAGELHVPVGRLNEPPENGPLFSGFQFENSCRLGGPGVPLARGPHDTQTGWFSFGSWHAGVCHFVLADGSVRAVSNLIDTATLGRLCHRRDGEPVGEF